MTFYQNFQYINDNNNSESNTLFNNNEQLKNTEIDKKETFNNLDNTSIEHMNDNTTNPLVNEGGLDIDAAKEYLFAIKNKLLDLTEMNKKDKSSDNTAIENFSNDSIEVSNYSNLNTTESYNNENVNIFENMKNLNTTESNSNNNNNFKFLENIKDHFTNNSTDDTNLHVVYVHGYVLSPSLAKSAIQNVEVPPEEKYPENMRGKPLFIYREPLHPENNKVVRKLTINDIPSDEKERILLSKKIENTSFYKALYNINSEKLQSWREKSSDKDWTRVPDEKTIVAEDIVKLPPIEEKNNRFQLIVILCVILGAVFAYIYTQTTLLK